VSSSQQTIGSRVGELKRASMASCRCKEGKGKGEGPSGEKPVRQLWRGVRYSGSAAGHVGRGLAVAGRWLWAGPKEH
jgi:hypothetical protein